MNSSSSDCPPSSRANPAWTDQKRSRRGGKKPAFRSFFFAHTLSQHAVCRQCKLEGRLPTQKWKKTVRFPTHFLPRSPRDACSQQCCVCGAASATLTKCKVFFANGHSWRRMEKEERQRGTLSSRRQSTSVTAAPKRAVAGGLQLV